MKRTYFCRSSAVILLALIAAVGAVFGHGSDQSETETQTVELYSPWEWEGDKARLNNELRKKSCLNLVSFSQQCSGTHIFYGGRFGDNWDVFAVWGNRESQTRMIDLGKYHWTDDFEVPPIEPWAKLDPDEKRKIYVRLSGADGVHGAPGMNADGTYPPTTKNPVPREGFADKPVSEQAGSTIIAPDGTERESDYSPFIEAKKGHIYAIRVFDPTNDYYVLVRVDDVISGVMTKISFRKL